MNLDRLQIKIRTRKRKKEKRKIRVAQIFESRDIIAASDKRRRLIIFEIGWIPEGDKTSKNADVTKKIHNR